MCRNSAKCNLVDVLDSLQIKNDSFKNQFDSEIKSLKKAVSKFSDKMLNGLAAKPLETVTISLPLIYEEYYEKNKDKVGYLDIRTFLRKSKILLYLFQFQVMMSLIVCEHVDKRIDVQI